MTRRFGKTWWSRRWIGALEDLGASWRTRLPRGRTYARQARVSLQRVEPGRVTAAVQGTRVRPYVVELRLPTFDDPTWARVVGALAGRVRHAAALLDGAMPEDVDEVLADCGVSLFPGPGELRTRCTCPDVANPCKHVAAVHYVLADAFDTDPFLLPALRGRDRAALLADLRAARAAADGATGPTSATPAPDLDDGVDWHELEARTLTVARGRYGSIPLHPAPPKDPAAVLRRLGPPPGGDAAAGPALYAAVAAAADRAWDLLVGGDELPDTAPDTDTETDTAPNTDTDTETETPGLGNITNVSPSR